MLAACQLISRSHPACIHPTYTFVTPCYTQVTKKTADQVEAPSRHGAYIHGLVLEGAGWDDELGVLEESRPKQLFTPMPVVLIRAVPVDKAPADNLYQCPVYFTERRFRWGGWDAWRVGVGGGLGGGLAGCSLAYSSRRGNGEATAGCFARVQPYWLGPTSPRLALLQLPARLPAWCREEMFTAGLKSKQPWTTWTTAGVCLFLDVV
jgi:hypothetical protein